MSCTFPSGRRQPSISIAPDVIHSFWMPGLGGKRDVVPHRVNRIVLTPEAPGEFLGQCAEYCGISHANMRFRVIVHPKEEFEQLGQEPAGAPGRVDRPAGAAGQGAVRAVEPAWDVTPSRVLRRAIGPNLTHFGSRKSLAANMMANTPANVAKWIENPDHMKPGARMPNLGMAGEQSKALAAYLLSLK